MDPGRNASGLPIFLLSSSSYQMRRSAFSIGPSSRLRPHRTHVLWLPHLGKPAVLLGHHTTLLSVFNQMPVA